MTNEHLVTNRVSRRIFLLLAASLALLMCVAAVAAIYLGQRNPTHSDLRELLIASEDVQRSTESRARAVQLIQGSRPPYDAQFAATLTSADRESQARISNAALHAGTRTSRRAIDDLGKSDLKVAAANRLMMTYGAADRAQLAALLMKQTSLIQSYAENVGKASRAIRGDIVTTRAQEEELDATITIGLVIGAMLSLLILGVITHRFILSLRREEQLSHSLHDLEQLQQLMLSAVAEAVIGLDQHSHVVFANPAAELLTGCDAEGLLGISCKQAVSFLDPQGNLITDEEDCFDRIIEAGESVLMTGRCRTIGNREFFAELVVNPIWVNGKIDGAVLLVRDITERHDTELMKDELLAVVGHELRTPLTSIRGSLGLLAAGAVENLSDDSVRLVTIAGDNTERLVRIVDDLLDMGRLDQRRMRMNLRRTCLVRICREVADTLTDAAQRRDVRINCTVAEDRISAILDPDRMQRVISNLLDNAVRMSPVGGNVDVYISREHDGKCRIEVIDDGPGVPEAERGRIFDRFVQIDSGDARQNGGLGLGLAICAEIVELHEGSLGVDGAPGRGARFRCDIPVTGPTLGPPDEAVIL